MKAKLFTLLAGTAFVASFAMAQAAEPTRLSPAQLDSATAGAAVAASLGLGITEAGSTASSTRAWQKAHAHSSIKAGSDGSVKVTDSASAKGGARASAANGGAASLAVGVAASGI
jgi:hypothetical protein